MKNIKSIAFIAATIGLLNLISLHADDPNFEIINRSRAPIEITAQLHDHATDKTIDIEPIVWDGGEYMTYISLRGPLTLTIFSGHDPRGHQYYLDIDPKKTNMIFLEWNHQGQSPRLRPQEIEKSSLLKRIFSKEKNKHNITAAQIKKVNQ